MFPISFILIIVAGLLLLGYITGIRVEWESHRQACPCQKCEIYRLKRCHEIDQELEIEAIKKKVDKNIRTR